MANVDKLKELINAINNFEENFDYKYILRTKPTGFNYKQVLSTSELSNLHKLQYSELTRHNCNTCGCILGFTLALNYPERSYKSVNGWYAASTVLEITGTESEWLFQPSINMDEDWLNEQEPYEDDYLAHKYLLDYKPTEGFICWGSCSHEEGVAEALSRINFMIKHYEYLETVKDINKAL